MYGKIYIKFNLSFYPLLSVQFCDIKHVHMVVQPPLFIGSTFSLDYELPEAREPTPVCPLGHSRALGAWQLESVTARGSVLASFHRHQWVVWAEICSLRADTLCGAQWATEKIFYRQAWLQAVSQKNSTNELVRRFSAFKVVFVLFTSHNYAEKHMVLGHIADEEKAQRG